MISLPLHRCTWFENSLARLGEAGYYVVALRDGDHRSWYLVCRPLEAADLKRLTSRDAGPLGIAVAVRVPLRFCPACGTNLEKLIRRDEAAFDALAAQLRSRLPADF